MQRETAAMSTNWSSFDMETHVSRLVGRAQHHHHAHHRAWMVASSQPGTE
jgi:hypothetical protein